MVARKGKMEVSRVEVSYKLRNQMNYSHNRLSNKNEKQCLPISTWGLSKTRIYFRILYS